jgi:tetratricopeptide (TPR) repeat protein
MEDSMRRAVVAIIFLALCPVWAESPAKPCPANQPVDEILATVHQLHSKRNNRNKSPLPNLGCILGWCMKTGKNPSNSPEEIKVEPPASDATQDAKAKADQKSCEFAFNDALHAAHNVEVGDQQVDEKNYRAALNRYEEALQQKPGDAAIHVRYARTAERLDDREGAKEHYKTAVEIGSPQKWVDEAKAALERLR